VHGSSESEILTLVLQGVAGSSTLGFSGSHGDENDIDGVPSELLLTRLLTSSPLMSGAMPIREAPFTRLLLDLVWKGRGRTLVVQANRNGFSTCPIGRRAFPRGHAISPLHMGEESRS
jgi:hypothetical protein